MTENSLLSHFRGYFGMTPKVTFESLFCDFNCFGVWGVLWGQEGHNSGGPLGGLIFEGFLGRELPF